MNYLPPFPSFIPQDLIARASLLEGPTSDLRRAGSLGPPASLRPGRLLPWLRRTTQPGSPGILPGGTGPGIRRLAMIAAGENHRAFLTTDGTLWSVGWNHCGQLGDGSTRDRVTPVRVATAVAAVAAGASHTVFLRTDGTLWATGYNFYGQLGDGSTINRCQPVLVARDVIAIAAGWWHTAFLQRDGTAWTMGYNYHGQLGLGSADCRAHPVPAPVHANIRAIATGPFLTEFRGADGAIRLSGQADDGQAVDGG